jgi:hypothetical protein
VPPEGIPARLTTEIQETTMPRNPRDRRCRTTPGCTTDANAGDRLAPAGRDHRRGHRPQRGRRHGAVVGGVLGAVTALPSPRIPRLPWAGLRRATGVLPACARAAPRPLLPHVAGVLRACPSWSLRPHRRASPGVASPGYAPVVVGRHDWRHDGYRGRDDYRGR